VAGKTGTAEGSGGPHAWFIGVAGEDAPEVAIAVLVESSGSGGRVAAPIARRVFEAWLELQADS
jgi:peptidoglycan glycosyltransferase